MTEVIVRHLVATSPGGDAAPSSGVNYKGRDGWLALITHLERKGRTTCRLLFSHRVAVSNVALCRAHSFAGADDVATPCLPCWDGAVLVVGSGRVFCVVVHVDASRSLITCDVTCDFHICT